MPASSLSRTALDFFGFGSDLISVLIAVPISFVVYFVRSMPCSCSLCFCSLFLVIIFSDFKRSAEGPKPGSGWTACIGQLLKTG